MTERSAGVIVCRMAAGKRLYLLLNYGRHWDFPKGHLEDGEEEIDAAVRELREETSVDDVRLHEGFVGRLAYWYVKKGRRRHKQVALFLGRTEQARVSLSDEHVGYAWLEFEDALNRLTYANAREVLRAAEAAAGAG